MRIAVDFMPRNYVRINVNWVYGSFYILKGQNVFPDCSLQFWNCFENNDDTLFAKFAASEHSIFYVRQFERNRYSCVRKSVPKIDEKCRFPALFFRRRCRLVHVEYARQPPCTTAPNTYISIPALSCIELHPSILAHSTVRNDIRRCSIEFSFPCAAAHIYIRYSATSKVPSFLWFSHELRK